ncbi:hypothetical protein [Cytobacillus gottheilii]|uniref:hypothetical protein n=1 Tax=Cytobacillus gottheilii TaxID=859144 RepID=UPI0009B93C62|nr:hypothetical protein [Cytobacillus gottheilii]
MSMTVRYAVKMKNGEYLRQDFDEQRIETVRLWSVENAIDADLFRSESEAQRLIKEVLTGNTNLLVLYDDENPPNEVVKLTIGFKID